MNTGTICDVDFNMNADDNILEDHFEDLVQLLLPDELPDVSISNNATQSTVPEPYNRSSQFEVTNTRMSSSDPEYSKKDVSGNETSSSRQASESDVWKKQYAELTQFKHRNGHCLVPPKYKDNTSLSMWVADQRYQYDLMKKGKSSFMTIDRIKALDALDFIWNKNAYDFAMWKMRYDELKLFIHQNGHCQVPQYNGGYGCLRHWIHIQRQEYMRLKMGEASSLTNDRIEILEAIGFTWGMTN
eukprot:CAMPEP_0172488280 /NCGR_PEP_ID=MMETSP1066-20121228/17738_1 /TAXON_ID=671091 /ORGANISM="Coscinodiscus wailesii, Strain CCMP2513" /LENGTH=242 /DNA_ID=CAMNT_0013255403 /DNA_START=39 /DNA_END=767 /DNA_ORIENTATION=-